MQGLDLSESAGMGLLVFLFNPLLLHSFKTLSPDWELLSPSIKVASGPLRLLHSRRSSYCYENSSDCSKSNI